jgi:hypothetical protein
MLRTATFLLLLCGTVTALAQTPPPGVPFDANKHPNPIITYVEEKDFKATTPEQVRKEAGIDLLGLAQDEAKRESLEMADGKFVKNLPILNLRSDVTFYPVVRQTFKLTTGSDLVMYSFRFPKVALPFRRTSPRSS